MPKSSGEVTVEATGRSKGFSAQRLGLRLSDDTAWERWQTIGTTILAHADASNWWIGDWVVFGESHYGRRYATAIEATGHSYKTLRNYAVVARRFSPARRRDSLSFAHHAEVTTLTDVEQDYWLDLAAREGWTRARLRRELNLERRPRVLSPSAAVVQLSVDQTRMTRWQEAADYLGADFAGWAIQRLDEAAELAFNAITRGPA